MFRLFRAMGYLLTFHFTKAYETLMGNEKVVAEVYDKAISEGAENFDALISAVGTMVGMEQSRVQEIKALTLRAEKHQKVKEGAKAAMQRVIDSLKAQGKSKEEVESETKKLPEFIRHYGNFKDASSSLDGVNAAIAEKTQDLEERKKIIAIQKSKLEIIQNNNKKLREEKQDSLGELAFQKSEERSRAIMDAIAGIDANTSATNKDLQTVRERLKAGKARAKVVSELAGIDSDVSENEYLELAKNSEADRELDSLLNWGEASPETKLADAKLPE